MNDPTATPAPVPTDLPPPTPSPTPSPVSGDEFAFDAEVLQQFTDDHPARIRFSFTNTSDRPIIISPRALGPYDNDFIVEEDSTGAKLVLLPPSAQLIGRETPGETEPPTKPENSCWTLDAGIRVPQLQLAVEVPKGETISEEFTCYAHQENANCLPAGEYRFTEEHSLQPGSLDDAGDGGNGQSVRMEIQNAMYIDKNGDLSVDVEQIHL